MYEIELKAHVLDRDNVINKLNSFATYLCSRKKSDVYYTLLKMDGGDVGVRIRTETVTRGTEISEERTFTYKRKENRVNADGTQIEVNDENEIDLTKEDAAVLEKMFLDLGKIRLTKTKIVENWETNTSEGTANIELCTVPPLGDFLEIEILTQDPSQEKAESVKNQIKAIFEKCGLGPETIESRYYSEMLKSVVK